MYRLISYLKFLTKSTNQHGIHSPFVYDLVTNCLYAKPRKAKHKTLNVLLKSLKYFEVRSLEILGNSEIKEEVKKKYPEISFSKELKDLIYFDSMPNKSFTELLSHIQIHNDTAILINGIHSNPSEFAKWSEFVKDEKITVSIDLYYCGVVFIRKEQVKQHFYIRI